MVATAGPLSFMPSTCFWPCPPRFQTVRRHVWRRSSRGPTPCPDAGRWPPRAAIALALVAHRMSSQGADLPEYIRRAIYGEMTVEEKRAAVDKSMNNWWREYAARKNDEEEEHVADTLLYDERCHLPRTVPRPDVVSDDEIEPRLNSSSLSAAPGLAAPSGYPSFIDSGFCTRAAYIAAIKLPPAAFAAAEAAEATSRAAGMNSNSST